MRKTAAPLGALALAAVLLGSGLTPAAAAEDHSVASLEEGTSYTAADDPIVAEPPVGTIQLSMTEEEALASAPGAELSPLQVAEAAAASLDTEPVCIACVDRRVYTQKVSGPVALNKRFVRYLTGAWAYSTGYSWSTSTTASSTLSADIGVSASSASGSLGVSRSVTKTYGITVNIYADRKRMSKLGLYSDYNRYYVRSGVGYGGASPKSWKYAYLYSPRTNQYLLTTYK